MTKETTNTKSVIAETKVEAKPEAAASLINVGGAILDVAKYEALKAKRETLAKSDAKNRGSLHVGNVPGYATKWIMIDSSDRPNRFVDVCVNDVYEPVIGTELVPVHKHPDGTVNEGFVYSHNNGNGRMQLVKKLLEFEEADLKENKRKNDEMLKHAVRQGVPTNNSQVSNGNSSVKIN